MRYVLIFLLCYSAAHSQSQKIAGLIQSKEGATEGLMLFSPLMSRTTYLIDACGRTVNTWQSAYNPAATVYLLPNGSLLRTNQLDNEVITGGGAGGGFEILDWNSNRLWSYVINSETQRPHHDAIPLPNGNILAIVWEVKSEEDCLANGRNPDRLSDNVVWAERLIEIKPVFPDGAEIVWEWSVWDHLIQDFDPTKASYGVVEDHPELVDINFTQTAAGAKDWLHFNSVDFNPDLNQIVVSSPLFNEFWIIDHSTTTEEAASHNGGNSGKGGDLLYRWGNPRAYKNGSALDQRLFGQHNAHWIRNGLPNEGSIMVFNNRPGPDYSSVDIIKPALNDNTYIMEDGKFLPSEQQHIYKGIPPQTIYSSIMAGAEMLPNGNILVCSTMQGRIVEITPAGEITWEYLSPITTNGIVGRDLPADQPFISDRNFRAVKYPLDYPGFTGKDLSPGEPIEGEPWPECALTVAVENNNIGLSMYPNPADDKLYIKLPDESAKISVRLLSSQGHELKTAVGVGEVIIDISDVNSGLLVAVVNNSAHKIIKVK